MKALVKERPGENGVTLKCVAEPCVKAGQVKIKVHAAGICGTDLHIVKDEYKSNYPVILGHEYSGIIEEVGDDVTALQAGDKVVSLTAAVTCGHCQYCYAGLLMLCDQRQSIGSGVNGAMTEYLIVPAHLVFKLPEGVSLDEAALCEPLACVVRAVIERATVKAGDYVLVSGPGAIGNLTMQVAIASGGKVVVTGTAADKGRLELASQLGAVATIIVDQEDVTQRVQEVTHGNGFDVAFECAGAAASAQSCLQLLKKAGLFVQVALYGKKIEFDHDLALVKEISITNSFASERTSWEKTLRLLQNKQVNVVPLISAKFPLTQWEEAFEMAIKKEGYKILLIP